MDRYQSTLAAFRFEDNLFRKKSVVIVQRVDELFEDYSNLMKIRFRYVYMNVKETPRIETLTLQDINSISSSVIPTDSSYKVYMANSVRGEIYEIPLKQNEGIPWLWNETIKPVVIYFLLFAGLIFLILGFRRSNPIKQI